MNDSGHGVHIYLNYSSPIHAPTDTGTGRETSLESRSIPALSGTGRDQYVGRDVGPSGSNGLRQSRTGNAEAFQQATCNAELAADLDVPTNSTPMEAPTRHDAGLSSAEAKPSGSADTDRAHSTAASPVETSAPENKPAPAQEAQQTGGQQKSQSEGGTSRQATDGQAMTRQQTPGQKRPPRSLPPSRGGSAEALDAQAGGLPPPVLWPGSSSAVPGDPACDGPPFRRFAPLGDVSTALDKQVSSSACVTREDMPIASSSPSTLEPSYWCY